MTDKLAASNEFIENMLSTRTVFDCKIFTVKVDEVALLNGSVTERNVVLHSGGVGVIAIDDDGNILMVRQFRYGVGRVSLEIPAGKLNAGEDPLECGKRELEEETGYAAGQLEDFGSLDPTPAYVSEVIHLYIAKGLRRTVQHLDEDEFLSVERIPLQEAVAMCMDGRITDAKTLVAVLKYAIHESE